MSKRPSQSEHKNTKRCKCEHVGKESDSLDSSGSWILRSITSNFSDGSDLLDDSTGIWYRHSGQPAVDRTPSFLNCKFKTYKDNREILEDIGTHHITHMYVREGDVPSLNLVAPKLTALKIEECPRDQTISALRSLKSLTELKELYIEFVDLRGGLPPVISQLTSLEKLGLEYCKLTDLSESVSSLSNLKYLQLFGNDFSQGLPEVITQLTSLETLSLFGCKLTNLPASLSSLVNLKVLVLSGNHFLNGLPEVVVEMTSLEKLYLDSLKLTNLPTSLSSLVNLKVLYLSRNHFPNGLPEVVVEMTSLEKLYLDSLELTNLPTSSSSLVNLKVLTLSGNHFLNGLPEVVVEMTSLEILDLNSLELTNLPTSLSSLVNLKVLDLSGNHFLNGLPEVFVEMTSLEELHLRSLKLTNLPTSFGKLTKLERLWLNENRFKSLPPEICELVNLSELNLRDNKQLEALHPGILRLSKLKQLDIGRCSSLTTPPPNVSKQGLKAIKQYYKDLEEGEGRSLPAATVSVIGKSKAGKTSLIRTLQQNARVLTGSVGTGEDVSTKVFNFEEVEVENTKLRFIDFGGQEIYHLAYGLTLRENCVPVIVVNMEMYKEMSDVIGDREAVRRLYFDWMAHLYLSQPNLPAPKLVITHKDMFSPEEFEEVKSRFLANSTSVRDSILSEESRLKSSEFRKIKHLSASTQMFYEGDIFEVGSEDDQDTFQSLKQHLLDRSKLYVMKVPRVWEEVEQSIQAIPTGFSRFEDLLPQLVETHEVEKEQLEIILTYMHYCGKLLWYKNVKGLSSYIFHKISAVTKLFNVLLDHDDARKWEERLQKFKSCQILSHNFQRQSYLQSVEKFKATGIVSSMLLAYLIHSETEFTNGEKLEVALELLTTFRLAFGKVKSEGEPAYIVPHFAVGYSPSIPMTVSEVRLHADLVLYGLPLPQYVYHEMTVELLKLFPSEMDAPSVKHNGAVVEVDDSVICLTHDTKAGQVTVSISGPTNHIAESWNWLSKIVNNIIRHVHQTWKAASLECVLHCAHCKLIGSKHPVKQINPSWSLLCSKSSERDAPRRKKVKCGEDTVFSALKYPCQSLSEEEMKELSAYVKSVKPTTIPPEESQASPDNRQDMPTDIQPPNYAGYSLKDVATILESCSLSITKDESIKVLYNNTDKVYKMTSPRGMALVINNTDFSSDRQLESRTGSATDLKNMKRMLEDLGFKCCSHQDLSSQELLSTIDETVRRHEDLEDYGMFVLVLMSHGTENDQIYGTDGSYIELKDVYYLLSCQNFASMAGKPKFVIVQACRGGLKDFGDKGRCLLPEDWSERSPQLCIAEGSRRPDGLMVYPRDEVKYLDRDDLITIRSSFNAYESMRHGTFGSPFISCLVHHFYQYACDKDVRTLCDMIQHDVREQSIKLTKKDPGSCFGQIPEVSSTLTNYRKIYLFPGYNGE